MVTVVCVCEWLLLCLKEELLQWSVLYGGLPKCRKFGCCGHTFQGNWLLLILMMVSTLRDVELII